MKPLVPTLSLLAPQLATAPLYRIMAHFFPDKLKLFSFSFSFSPVFSIPLSFSVFIFVLVFLPSFHSLVIAVLGTLNW